MSVLSEIEVVARALFGEPTSSTPDLVTFGKSITVNLATGRWKDRISKQEGTAIDLVIEERGVNEKEAKLFVADVVDRAKKKSNGHADEISNEEFKAMFGYDRVSYDADEPEEIPIARSDYEIHGDYKSKFGAVRWGELEDPRQPYEWLLRNIIPARERFMVFGAPGCGKSFMMMDLAIALARGLKQYFTYKIPKPIGVVYCAFEGGKGFPTRVNAYRKEHKLEVTEDVPFVMLTRDVNLFSSEELCKELLVEIKHYGDTMAIPLGLVVFDTVSACAPQMNDSATEDVGKFLSVVRFMQHQLDCAFGLVHHTPKIGDTPRGSGKFTGDLEATIFVDYADGFNEKSIQPIRRATTMKQREGERGLSWEFKIEPIDLGRGSDGFAVKTCVVRGLGQRDTTSKKEYEGFYLNDGEKVLFQALMNAYAEVGIKPPPQLQLPSSVKTVVTGPQWKEFYTKICSYEGEKRDQNIRQAMSRMSNFFLSNHIIGRSDPYIWFTGKWLRAFPHTRPRRDPDDFVDPNKPVPEPAQEQVGTIYTPPPEEEF